MKLQIGIDGKSYEVEVEITEDDMAPKPHYIPPQPSATVLTADGAGGEHRRRTRRCDQVAVTRARFAARPLRAW